MVLIHRSLGLLPRSLSLQVAADVVVPSYPVPSSRSLSPGNNNNSVTQILQLHSDGLVYVVTV